MLPRHLYIGQTGEMAAANYLEANNYEIIEKNWRYKKLEVDIIARKANKLHFVEVKTRSGKQFGHPEESISNAKMNNLKKAAEQFLLENTHAGTIQFDVIAITLHRNTVTELFVIEDVFF